MRNSRGFTFIDVLIGVFLLLIVFLGIFRAFQLGLKVTGLSKNKITATAVANQKIEEIRNLPYNSIGIKGGFPDGVLDAATTTICNNTEYKIETRVDYVVNSADGIAAPEDECPNDYKKAEIKVSWLGQFGGEVKISTDISPENLSEECVIGGGVLSVTVFDAYGNMVTSPLIEIRNPATNETLKTATPETGKHYFSLATSTYKVVVSKPDFSSEQTFGSGDSYDSKTIITPEKPHPMVLEGQLIETSFSIDRLSVMTVENRGSKGMGYPVIHNVTFNLTGVKKVGTDFTEKPIYKYSQNQTTNGPGQATINNLEWDSYTFSVVIPDLDLIEIESPLGATTTQPIGLPPNTNQNVRLILKAENSLLITVQDVTSLEPIFSAATRLYNTELGYDKTQYTNEKGQTYFIPLESANYNLEISAPGYLTTSTTVWVSGSATKIVELEQIE